MRDILFSEILRDEYKLVSVLSNRNGQQLIRYRNIRMNKDIAVRIVPLSCDLMVYKKLCDVNNQNIVRVLDVIEEKDKAYVVEEFIDGIPLNSLVPLKKKGAENVLQSLCYALRTVHSLGIIHKDIKEDNVLVTNKGTVKLVDFNISKVYKEDKNLDTNFLGTVTYAPPEQYGLVKTNCSSDIYSLAILINHILTGKHPAVEMYSKGKLGKFIDKATNININQRYSSIEQVIRLFRW